MTTVLIVCLGGLHRLIMIMVRMFYGPRALAGSTAVPQATGRGRPQTLSGGRTILRPPLLGSGCTGANNKACHTEVRVNTMAQNVVAT
ncbi:hypothetical protein BKA67DRAFT_553900 [Truncatella angustata]|uniref:Uncharacterized protein n=1 Tax=Truncatella angustata TaxID=152316 RepID=A0A9P8UR82_9PEZI|nr:uncharacterized protein BKA67DRAFT_553900 [Truncatella angustata]KAH6656982.1 hypothetical protein BKA67DRAFT_553900 [Truncatella angustata]